MIDWKGRTVVCIASGPSLTAEDCELVRKSGHPAVVTNNCFRLCPWADAMVAFDGKWWKLYGAEVVRTFAGRKICTSLVGPNYGAESVYKDGPPWFSVYRNSGACAVAIAIASGASKVVLLGYDASDLNGRKHWHEDHPPGLENASSMASWPKMFELLARNAIRAGISVLNASRHTALNCFSRCELEDVL